jgi:DNA-binding winged helix-turn-helix (wHTH) protein/tetratricopeptide (TPR) repeat protein
MQSSCAKTGKCYTTIKDVFVLDSHLPSPTEYRFESFRLVLKTGELTKLGMRVRLQGQPLQLLMVLLEQSGEVVTRDAMKTRLWPADTFVDFEHSLNTAIKKLRQTLGDSATEPRYIETLPRVGYRFLAKVEPAAAPATVSPAGDTPNTVFDKILPPRIEVSTADVRRRWRRRIGYAILPVLLAGAVLVFDFGKIREHLRGIYGGTEKSSAAASPAPRPRNSIAILEFENLSGRPEEQWLSTALSEMLTTELGAGGRLLVIPGENIARMKRDLALAPEASYTRESLQRIRGNLGADMIVLGCYTALGEKSGGQIRLDLRLQDAVTGETSAILSTTGTEAKLFDLVSQAGEQLRQKVGVGTFPSADSAILLAALPDSPQAAQLYAQGLERLRGYDSLGARPLLERAVQASPKFALAHSALSVAWTNLGYQLKSREEARTAFELSSSLSKEQQLFIEGRYRTVTNDWKKAADVYETLYTLYPDNLEYGLQLTNAQVYSRKAKDALATLESIRKMSLSAAYLPRVDLALAFAKEALSDLNGAIESAHLAESESRAIGAKELEARAWHVEATALRHIGQPEKSRTAYEQAKQLFESIGSKGSVALVLCDEALVDQDHGNVLGAMKMFEDSLVVFRSVGDESSVSAALADIAGVLKSEGNLAGAKKKFLEAMAIRKEVGGRLSSLRFELATIALDEGNLGQAKSEFTDLLAASVSANEKFGISLSQAELAGVLCAQGDLLGARKLYEDSLAVTRSIGDEENVSLTLSSLAMLSLEQGDLPAAHRAAQEAVDIQQKLTEKAELADTRETLAAVVLEEGNAAESESLARQALEAFATQKAAMKAASAEAILAMALVAEKKLEEARKIAGAAAPVAAKSQFLAERLTVATRVALVQAALGHARDAVQTLFQIQSEATRAGLVPQQFEARLALCEIELKSGKSALAHTQLANLKRDASSRGFMLIARKTDELAAAKN